jgi:DNA-binding transcriptional LysR family regulator
MARASDVNLNRLAVFVAVIEAGSLTAAAERLGIAKTMVSTHMQRLEAEVGASLLVRTTRRVSVTEAGTALYEASRQILNIADEALQAVEQGGGALRGTLRVATPVDYGTIVVAPVLAALRQQHPALNIELVSNDRLVNLLAEGIDVAIRVGRLADSSHRAVKISSFVRWLVASPAFVAARGNPATPAAIADLPYVGMAVLPKPLTVSLENARGRKQTLRFRAGFLAGGDPGGRRRRGADEFLGGRGCRGGAPGPLAAGVVDAGCGDSCAVSTGPVYVAQGAGVCGCAEGASWGGRGLRGYGYVRLTVGRCPSKPLRGVDDGCLEETTELAGKLDRDARMDGALLVEEALSASQREHALVPNVRMNVETLLSVETKAHELLGRDVVPGQRQWHIERPMVEREKQLSAIRVVVRVPEQHALRFFSVVFAGGFGLGCIRKDVMTAYRLVATVENIAAPFADKDAFGGAGLVAGVGVDGS